MTYFSDEEYRALTSSQRTVLDCFKYATAPLTVAGIHKELRKKITRQTIQRAVDKLCRMRVLERLTPPKKGRGYSNMYTVVTKKDDDALSEDEALREEGSEKEVREESEEGDPLAELDELLARYKRQTKE